MVEMIVIEAETPGDSRTMFRLWIDATIVGEGLTAAQAHVLVGEILDRITLPRSEAAGVIFGSIEAEDLNASNDG